jgi:hypothetical protein
MLFLGVVGVLRFEVFLPLPEPATAVFDFTLWRDWFRYNEIQATLQLGQGHRQIAVRLHPNLACPCQHCTERGFLLHAILLVASE